MDREPDDLRSDARRMLVLWRDADDIPADARRRVQRRLAAADTVDPKVSGTRTWTIAVAVAAAVILAWWVAAYRSQTTQARHDPTHEQASDHAATRNGEMAPTSATTLPPAELPAPSGVVADVDDGGDITVADEPVQRPRSVVGDAPRSGSTLERERLLIQAAWKLLAAGDPDGALLLVDTHARQFAEGVLAPERRAVAIVAWCKRGDADATSRAATWLTAQPRSPLAGRVRAACNLPVSP